MTEGPQQGKAGAWAHGACVRWRVGCPREGATQGLLALCSLDFPPQSRDTRRVSSGCLGSRPRCRPPAPHPPGPLAVPSVCHAWQVSWVTASACQLGTCPKAGFFGGAPWSSGHLLSADGVQTGRQASPTTGIPIPWRHGVGARGSSGCLAPSPHPSSGRLPVHRWHVGPGSQETDTDEPIVQRSSPYDSRDIAPGGVPSCGVGGRSLVMPTEHKSLALSSTQQTRVLHGLPPWACRGLSLHPTWPRPGEPSASKCLGSSAYAA